MDKLRALPLGRQLILGAGVLLLLDTFLDWQHVSASFGGVTVGGGQSAWHGFWGVIMGLALIVLLAWTAAKAFGVDLPAQVPDGLTTLGLGLQTGSAWWIVSGVVIAVAGAIVLIGSPLIRRFAYDA